MPDAHIGYQWLHLTRGQWLSFGMVAAGLALFAVVARRKDPPMGGWAVQPEATANQAEGGSETQDA